MAARLGNVIYWLGLAIAVVAGILFVGVVLAWNAEPPPGDPPYIRNGERSLALLAVIGIGSWLVGRAARYILAGK